MPTRLVKLLSIASIVILSWSTATVDADEVSAFVEPYRDIEVSSPEMGTLAFVKVNEGDYVAQGQVLAGLDEEVLLAGLRMAQKAMSARGRLQAAQAELRQREQQLQKLEELLERKHASRDEVAKARLQVELAQAQVQTARDEIAVKTAEYQRIEAQLESKRIKSPIDGIVVRVLRDEGEFVSANDPVVANVVQLDPLLVVFSVPAMEAKKLKVNQELPLFIGESRQPATGAVEFVSPTADAQTGTTRVKIRIPNSDGEFQSGDGCWLAVSDSAAEEKASANLTRNTTSKRSPRQVSRASH